MSKNDYALFIKNKISFFETVITKSIKAIQQKYLYEIIKQNEVKLSINNLLNISKNLKYADSIEKLQEINKNISEIIQKYGTGSFQDLVEICYGNKNDINTDNDKYNIIKEYFTPINYKIVNYNEAKRQPKNLFNLLNNSKNLHCMESINELNIFYLQVCGITIILHDNKDKKYIITDGYIDNLPFYSISNNYLDNLRNNIINSSETNNSFSIYINSLTIRDCLIYNETEIIQNYHNLIKKARHLNDSSLIKVMREYLISDSYYQRNITIALLIHDSQYSQYLAYLLYDLLSDESNKQFDSNKQISIYNTLPHELKQYFKNSIKNTLTYIDDLDNNDENKMPLEQQICLMKTSRNVKEKAMTKLKELKSKSEDSGSKTRQYLEGLLKIPFGIYKSNRITNIKNNNILNFITLYNNIHKSINSNDYIDNSNNNFLISEIKKSCWGPDSLENKLISSINYKFINSLLKYKSNLTKIKNTHTHLKNLSKKNIIQNIINDFEIKKFIFYQINNPFSIYKNNLNDISNNNAIISNYINDTTKILDKAIYGHNTAKRQIERIIAQWINGENSGYCLGFEGPPGIGKTSLAKKGISNCLKDDNNESRPFSFIAIGGSCNASTIDGHNYTYVGSTWGKIVDILMDTKCMNPIIFIDELDKVSKSDQGKEIIGVLTHITDYTQNDTFQDKYFTGIDLDLSKILFIFSYNDVNAIDRILLDRIHRIKFDVITNTDKIIITQQYILPELFKKMGIINKIIFSDDIILYIIETFTQEPGVRKLKEILFEIVGEINLNALKNENQIDYPINITINDLKFNYLKQHNKITNTYISKTSEIGLINGLWANALNFGGIMQIQAKFFPSNVNYDLKLTGQQGDVMKESMNVAKSLAYLLISEYNNDISLNKNAIHVHCPDGATPKDGPSAGTAIALVIYSLLSSKKIRNYIAITGEINLFGDISKIGGLEFKVMGAYKANVKTIIYPLDNQEEIDKLIEKYTIFSSLNFIAASNIREIIDIVFLD